MVFDTKTWLKAVVINYDRGQPYLLQYVLKEKEIDNLTNLIDALTDLRIEAAMDARDNNSGSFNSRGDE